MGSRIVLPIELRRFEEKREMEMTSPSNAPTVFNLQGAALDEVYWPLPWLYVGFLATWCFSTFYSVNTWRNRHLE
ncbi:hypothetical protein HPP92_024169 [Vanilla planifolia]|uniref:Uncharacterized protein n=1 Tax=Vanilla planifolia TaxID=51239 RepID=A0A835PNQ5_VANPL|nr:hypothetical protein HPP92_024169 [Vanilla planifolia]